MYRDTLVNLKMMLAAVGMVLISVKAYTAEPKFIVHKIGTPEGTNFGQTSAVDVDRDGDLDFISGTQRGVLYWSEFKSADQWDIHRIGDGAKTDVAGISVDVNGDEWLDQVSGGTWFENPGNPRDAKHWIRHETGAIAAHDHRLADVDNDGRLDLFSILDRAGVYWYQIPQDKNRPWPETKITGRTEPQCHGGLAVGDIDGDGDVDVARVDRWLENVDGIGTHWKEHLDFAFGKAGPWGIQTKPELFDIDRDGDLDLIQAEGDVLDGRVAIFFNDDHGNVWTTKLLKAEGHHQDFHSLCVADFDNDGDADIFTGGGPLTQGNFQWFLFEQIDKNTWKEHLIQEGLQTHESVAADVDRDGDIDILTKPWGGNQHLFVENLVVDKK
jgi:hypothetical protein